MTGAALRATAQQSTGVTGIPFFTVMFESGLKSAPDIESVINALICYRAELNLWGTRSAPVAYLYEPQTPFKCGWISRL